MSPVVEHVLCMENDLRSIPGISDSKFYKGPLPQSQKDKQTKIKAFWTNQAVLGNFMCFIILYLVSVVNVNLIQLIHIHQRLLSLPSLCTCKLCFNHDCESTIRQMIQFSVSQAPVSVPPAPPVSSTTSDWSQILQSSVSQGNDAFSGDVRCWHKIAPWSVDWLGLRNTAIFRHVWQESCRNTRWHCCFYFHLALQWSNWFL